MRAVPHLPLLWLALLVATPAATAFVYAEGSGKAPAALVLFLIFAAALVDWILSRDRFNGISMETPELVRCTKGKEVILPIVLSNRGKDPGWVRYGVELPFDFRSQGDVIGMVGTLEPGRQRSLSYALMPLRRGRFFLETGHLEARSRLGLWLVRKRFPLSSR